MAGKAYEGSYTKMYAAESVQVETKSPVFWLYVQNMQIYT